MRTKASLLLIAALAAGTFIGCSGDDPTPTVAPSPTPSEAPTPTATDTEIPSTPTPPTPTPCADVDGDGVCATVDCDDAVATTFPGADELCDGVDNDCDESTDEGLDATYYADADGDGFGTDVDPQTACEAPEGHVEQGGDCDDENRAVYPGRLDTCDNVNNDCDETTDEDANWTVYPDVDEDGYGDSSAGVTSCELGSNGTLTGGDCDDADGDINPGAQEVWESGTDENCNGQDDSADVYVMKAGETAPGEDSTTFETIGEAIDAALTGLTIGVGPGRYIENLDFEGKDLKLISIEGPEATIIDGSGAEGAVILFDNGEGVNAEARVEGFTLTGGTGSEPNLAGGLGCGLTPGFSYGGAIFIE